MWLLKLIRSGELKDLITGLISLETALESTLDTIEKERLCPNHEDRILGLLFDLDLPKAESDFEECKLFFSSVVNSALGLTRLAIEVCNDMVQAPRPSMIPPVSITPAKRMACLGPHCKNTTSSKTGFCSFDCEDWSRLLSKKKVKQ